MPTESYTHWYRLELELIDKDKPLGYRNIPVRSDENAGYDLYCAAPRHNHPVVDLIPLGVKARLVKINAQTNVEEDSHYWLIPRSSIFKTGLMMANSLGVIDKTYRGELKAPTVVHHATDEIWNLAKEGDRLFQIVAPDMGWIREVLIVDSLPTTVRGDGGFGSTGK
jgi:deoxyuridine 5'-triphosphate nucleotidohydrolase